MKNGMDMAGGVRGGYVAMPYSWFPLPPFASVEDGGNMAGCRFMFITELYGS